MMNRLLPILLFLICLVSCKKVAEEDFGPYDNTEEVNRFWEIYNKRHAETLAAEQKVLEKTLADMPADDAGRAETERQLAKVIRRQERDFFQFKTLADLPPDIQWTTNWDEPEVGSPEAKKGGQFNYYFEDLSFPPTIRVFGREGNNSFRSEHWDYVEMGLIHMHPNTGALIPGLASAWWVAPDKRTVYFKIDPEARFSDGHPVTAEDFFMTFYIYLSDYLTETFYRQYYSSEYDGITMYDDKIIAVSLSEAKPIAPFYAGLNPLPRHFYQEFGPDFEERYNWRVRPTTGAYKLGEVVKGRSITLERVKDWWAKDRPYTKYRYNVDRIEYRLIRQAEKAFEMFKKGQIDLFLLGQPKRWYEQTEIPEVWNGYIEKATFYNEYPLVPRGLYLNFTHPLLQNKDIRIGLQHASNFQKVIDIEMRGDAKRINTFADGYGRFTEPNIRARSFDPAKAREAFARAGFTKAGPDGVLTDDQGRRLSFRITYPNIEFTKRVMQRLKEEALLAGVDFRLEATDGAAMFQQVQQKKHEICYMGWGTEPPFPRYRQHFHSEEAFDEKGNPRPMTNNISSYADPTGDMDRWSDAVQGATSEDQIQDFSFKIENKIHEEAIWIPAFETDSYRLGYWRWLKWPADFNVRLSRYPYESFVYWIDEETKEATLEAKRKGEVFPEVNKVFEQFRKK